MAAVYRGTEADGRAADAEAGSDADGGAGAEDADGDAGAGADIDAIVAGAGLWEQRNRRAGQLDYGNSRRLELARAAAAAPAFLLLDEPTSGMSDAESLAMVESVRRMPAAVGAGVLVIDHDLNFITGICDRVYCLDQGRVIAVGTPAEVQADAGVKAAYLGEAAQQGAAQQGVQS